MMKKMMGFTLAEVLTTLMVIGVVAAMTIPTLMNSTNDQQLKVAYKKAMSVLGQGVQLMVAKEVECDVHDDASLAKCFSDNVLSGTPVASDKDNSGAQKNVIATSDGMAYAFYYGDTTHATAGTKRNFEDICGLFGSETGQIGSGVNDYNASGANCFVVVDVNGFNKGAKGFDTAGRTTPAKVAAGGFTGFANATDQQGIILAGNGVRPVYAAGNLKGYQWMFGESAKPFSANPN